MSASTSPRPGYPEVGLPRLVIPAPECGHCGNEVQIEHTTASCLLCRVEWKVVEDGAVSEPEPGSPPCNADPIPRADPSEDTPPRRLGPCILPMSHGGDCIHPKTTPARETTHA